MEKTIYLSRDFFEKVLKRGEQCKWESLGRHRAGKIIFEDTQQLAMHVIMAVVDRDGRKSLMEQGDRRWYIPGVGVGWQDIVLLIEMLKSGIELLRNWGKVVADKKEDNEFGFRCGELEIVEYQCKKLIL